MNIEKQYFLLSITIIVGMIILYIIIYLGEKKLRLRKKYNSKKINNNIYCKNKFCLIEENKIPKYEDIPYFREIPCNGDIYKIFWVAKSFELGVSIKGFIGANILKWINERKVNVIKKDDKISLHITRFDSQNIIENELKKIILDISEDEYIDIEDIKNKVKYSQNVIKWYDNIFYNERDRLIEENYLIKRDKLVISSKVYQDIAEIVGLIKYLKSETYISEKRI